MSNVSIDQVVEAIFGVLPDGSPKGFVFKGDKIPIMQQALGKSSSYPERKGPMKRMFSIMGLGKGQSTKEEAEVVPLKTMKQVKHDLSALGLPRDIVYSVSGNLQEIFIDIYQKS